MAVSIVGMSFAPPSSDSSASASRAPSVPTSPPSAFQTPVSPSSFSPFPSHSSSSQTARRPSFPTSSSSLGHDRTHSLSGSGSLGNGAGLSQVGLNYSEPQSASMGDSRPGTRGGITPSSRSGAMSPANAAGGIPGGPTNDDIEAIIKMATASSARSPANPPRDTRTQLFVGNLPYRVRWQDLKDLFRRAGTVLRADVSLGPDNRSRGYGTVLLATAEDAGRAVDMFNGYVWQTRTLEVRPDRLGVATGGMSATLSPGMGGFGEEVPLGLNSMGLGSGSTIGVSALGANIGVALGGLGALGAAGSGAGTPFGQGPTHTPATLATLGRLGSVSSLSAQSGASSPFALDEEAASAALLSRINSSQPPFLGTATSGNGGAQVVGGGSSLASSGLSSPLSVHAALSSGGPVGGLNVNPSGLSSRAGVGPGSGTSSPLLGTGPITTGSLNGVAVQLTGASNTGSGPMGRGWAGGGGEKSRSLFVGNLPFHIQWQDLKDLFRQAGTILRADVALGPDGRSRGFGTVSYATEHDAERAVRMFDGYEYNGRPLKVHFDKFSPSAATAAPLVIPSNYSYLSGASLSAPQSPIPGVTAPLQTSIRPSPLSHAPSFAVQLALYQRQEQLRQEQERHIQSLALQSRDTDQPFGYQAPLDETISHLPGGGLTDKQDKNGALHPPSSLRYQFHQQQAESQQEQPPYARTQSAQSSSATATRPDPPAHMQSAPMYISLPQFRAPRAIDFSPGSPYAVYGVAAEREKERAQFRKRLMEQEVMQSSNVYESEGTEQGIRPSTSPAPPSRAPGIAHSHSQSESFAILSQEANNRQQRQQSQVTSPTSPTSSAQQYPRAAPQSQAQTETTSQAQHHHMHPAHPGPIALPPPPSVAAFHGAPLSPMYGPAISPYVSPLHHPAVMMGMMGMGMTPHGLPPLTPSMPSFTFIPQQSSGIQNAAPSSGVPPSETDNTAITPGASGMEGQAVQGYIAHHLHHPHGPMLSPYTPFSPGVTMSPGAFWGRPGVSGNPYMNAAVGAPVHSAQQPVGGYFPPAGEHQSVEEPPSYFPPFSSASRPSGLANEIKEDNSSAPNSNPSVRDEHTPDSILSLGTTTGTGVGTSPALGSSRTSWKTDSSNPSPMHNLANSLESLTVNVPTADSTNLSPFHNPVLVSNQKHRPPLAATGAEHRADSCPLSTTRQEGQMSSELQGLLSAADAVRSVSDSVTS